MTRPTISIEDAHKEIAARAHAMVPAICVANIEHGKIGGGLYRWGAEENWDWRRTQVTLAIAMAGAK